MSSPSPRKVVQWCAENWDFLDSDTLEMLLGLRTAHELELAQTFAPFEIPRWFLPAEMSVRTAPKVYRVEIDGSPAYFVLRERSGARWRVEWLYTEENLRDLDLHVHRAARPSRRRELMPGCAVTSTHTQDDFDPEGADACPELSVVGHYDMDRQRLTLDRTYLQCLDLIEACLARGAGDRAKQWAAGVWMAHGAVNELEVAEIEPLHGRRCDVCNLRRTVTYRLSVGQPPKMHRYVGAECMQALQAAIDVVTSYNDVDAREEAADRLQRLHCTAEENHDSSE